QLVAFPTETVYGLGAAALDPQAVARIYELKGRPKAHPLIVHLPPGQPLGEWAEDPPELALGLARRFWPGPLTLVLRRGARVPDAVTGGQNTVALRTPDHPVALALLEAFGGGVAAPSANRFGHISPTRAEHVAAEFGGDLLILDGGPSQVGLESTILDLSQVNDNGLVRLLRPGGVPLAAIEAHLGFSVQLPALAGAGEEGLTGEGGAPPRAPGGLASHYAPQAPTRLVTGAELARLASSDQTADLAVLALGAPPQGFRGHWRALPEDPVEYGRQLYAALRELDAAAPKQILIEVVPTGEAWLAVRDRLKRAAT
ncbi:MAG: L-threonylcarbamoyladenylate synthase, partial [Trueperaceae bacterium]